MNLQVNRVKNILKWSGLSVFIASTSGILWTTYDINRRLRKPLSTNFLHSRAEFIFIPHNYFQEPVRDFLNEFFEEETRIYSFLYNIKKKLTFTKLEYALKTLRVAKHANGDTFLRNKALRNLSKLDLDYEWEYDFLSQYLDASTSISLARCECASALIKKPRGLASRKSNCDIVNDVKGMLENMSDNKCVKFILETTSAFESIKDHDHETSLHELHHVDDHILQSLDHFLHLTLKSESCQQIAQHDGLDILLDIYKNNQDDFNIKMILCKIITNMSSVNSDYMIDHLFKSGWIYLMSKWQNDEDLRIQVFASTFLNNLDKYDKTKHIYRPKLYPLYPRGKTVKKPDLDLVFVHGLLGGIWITWRVQRESDMIAFGNGNSNGNEAEFFDPNMKNSFFKEEAVFMNERIVQMEPTAASKILTVTEQTTNNVLNAINEMAEEKLSLEELQLTRKILKHLVQKINEQKYSYCWPIDWLPPLFPNIRILGLQFESSLSYWTSKVCACENNKRRLRMISMDYLERLKNAGVGEKSIIWVSHSMGGLIVKYIINLALSSDDPKIRKIGENSHGIVFLGVPHRGSSIAKLSQQASVLWPTVEVKDLEENSKELLKLNDEFLENAMKMKTPMEIVSIAEGTSTKIFQNIKLHVVPITSAYLGYGDFYISQENHLNLSKPLSQNSFLYLTVVNLIEKILKQQTKAHNDES